MTVKRYNKDFERKGDKYPDWVTDALTSSFNDWSLGETIKSPLVFEVTFKPKKAKKKKKK